MNEKAAFIRAGGLWKNQSKDGRTFLSGSLGGIRVWIFPNGYKEKENDPDYILSFSQNEKREQKQVNQAESGDAWL